VQRAKGTFAHDLKGYLFNSRGCPNVLGGYPKISVPFLLRKMMPGKLFPFFWQTPRLGHRIS
jgi:hypothetical protein